MDLLNITGEEGLGLQDLTFGFNEVPTGLQRELTDGVLQASGGASIFSGFVPSAQAASGPVVVGQVGVANRALLSQVSGGRLITGTLVATGADTQAIDISTYAAGTYGIYLAFQRVEAEPQSRSIWSGVDLAEYSKVVPTRLAGIWQVRIENPAPGPEWTRIGECTITSAGSGQGNTVTVQDKRPLYFEGTFEKLYRPTWGAPADRQLRRTATITNLQQMLDALKQCIVDIKGPNVARWYDSFITGLNVGPDFAATDSPTAGRVAVGDANFYLQGDGLQPRLAFYGTTDYLQCDRYGGSLTRYRNGLGVWRLGPSGETQVGANTLYPGAMLSVHGYGAPRTLAVVDTGGFGSLGLGSVAENLGGYIALGAASTLGGTPRWGIYGAAGTNALFQLQSSQGTFLQVQPNSASSGDFTTLLRGQTITLNPTNSGVTQVYGSTITLSPGNSLQLYGPVAFADRQIYYGALPWAVGNFSASQANPNGRRATCSRAVSFNVDGPSFGAASGGEPRAFIIFSDPLPANAVISAGAYNISDDGTNQRGFACTPQVVSSTRVDFYLARGSEAYTYGSFWFRVDYGRT